MDAQITATRSSATPYLAIWHVAQLLVWAVGMFIWWALIFQPKLGLHLLWNVLIPIAPALLVLAPGVWRNVCPLSSIALAPQHFGFSKSKRISKTWRGRLFLGGCLLLVLVVPLRKVVLDTNGPLLAAILAVVGLLAFGLGCAFKWKSGWCASLCPVYPVELLYGAQPQVSVPNAHCSTCLHCVAPCSESTAGLTPRTAVDTNLGRSVGMILTGFFPGFVWGWYNVPTYGHWEGFRHLHVAYGMPYGAGAVTLCLYLLLVRTWPRSRSTHSATTTPLRRSVQGHRQKTCAVSRVCQHGYHSMAAIPPPLNR